MDSSVSEKLQLLINSKLEIAQAIRDCGIYVSDEDGFLQFPDLIRSIKENS